MIFDEVLIMNGFVHFHLTTLDRIKSHDFLPELGLDVKQDLYKSHKERNGPGGERRALTPKYEKVAAPVLLGLFR